MRCLFLLSSLGLVGLVTASGAAEVDAGSSRAGLTASLAVALCGTAVAASGLLCWRRRQPSTARDEQPKHDLARLQDSVTVAKRKSGCGACSVVPAQQHNCAATPADGDEDEAAAALRMVVFDSLPEEQKQRLKASSIQDSVIILRTKQTISRNASRADRQEDEARDDEQSSKIVAFKPGTLLLASTATQHTAQPEQASEQEQQQQLFGAAVPMDAAQGLRQPGQLFDGDGAAAAATVD